ncbi:MAG: copper chaperone PCu(A)C [Pseudomonadota bacterium]
MWKKALRLTVLLVIAAAVVGFLLWPRSSGEITLTDAKVAPTGSGAGAVFLSIANRGRPDRLIAVSSPVAEAEIYSPGGGPGPPIPSGEAALAADGAHIRLGGLGDALQPGSLIPLTLTFERAGAVTAKAIVTDPAAHGAAAEVGLFGMGDICRVGPGEPAPRISLSVVPYGERWQVRVAAEDFTFSEELDGSVHLPGTGHGHIYVGGMKLGRLYSSEATIGPLPPGRHEVRVTLNTNDHRAYVVGDQPVSASAVIEVD